ncbi:MAG: glycosyltransferase family 4 protein [bacterium]|nr:glycosyltransferase family 4 protein [bacterium]
MPHAKPRILFCVTSGDWGGVQFFLYNFAKFAQKNGFDVRIAAGEDGELGEKCLKNGIPFTRLKHVKRSISPIQDLAGIHEIRILIREYQPDFIHLNSSKMSIIGSIASRLEEMNPGSLTGFAKQKKKPRVMYRIGGWVFREKIHPLKQWMYLALEQWTARYKDVIVTVHPEDEVIAQEKNIRPRDRVLTIANGIDLEHFNAELKTKEEARRILGIDPQAFIVGTIANFYPPKNLPWLLHAIQKFHNVDSSLSTTNVTHESDSIQYVIIGDGPDHDAIHSLYNDLHLQNRIILAGRRTDASTLLRAFDIFILPSTKEGMPWTLLEAMATGLPCIATDVGACAWMLQDSAGIIIPVNNEIALFDAVAQIQSDRSLATELGNRAKRAVSARFAWESTRDMTLGLFH